MDHEAQWVEAQRQVAADIWHYAQPLCLNPPAALAPTQERAAQATACELWSKYINTANKDIYWRGAYDDYTALLNLPALSATLRAQLQQVQQSILSLIRTQYDKDVLPLKQKVLTAQSSWWFVLACASCAVLGIALKWAKAALDAFPHHQP
ncbi:MAG TPA: hypothetical protein VFW93_14385 [Aquabacterium sp.]|nr:hypothetical protein [Aquabacterium sp.]